jgi:hypothetical protein
VGCCFDVVDVPAPDVSVVDGNVIADASESTAALTGSLHRE